MKHARPRPRWRRVLVAASTAVLAAGGLTLVTAPWAAAGERQAGDHAGTQAVLDRYLSHAGPGATVFAGGPTGTWNVHAGTGLVNADKPILPTEHVRIASQTKTFTASVVLQLVDEGKVELNAPIERYLPGVVDGNGYDGSRITVRELLQHTSGVPVNEAPKAHPDPDGTYPLRELVRDGLSRPPAFPPGTSFQYSNTNYQIAGLLIEKVTGKPVGDAITDRIIRPLGLTGTRFPRAGDRTPGDPYAHGYAGGRQGPVFLWVDNTTALEPSLLSSAGAMVSTLADLATFEQALTDGRVVSAASLAEMRRTVAMPGGSHHSSGDGYGLGVVRLDLSCGGQAWGHAGDTAGYSSLTMATTDGRHASLVTNTLVDKATGTLPTRFDVIDSALCGTPAS